MKLFYRHFGSGKPVIIMHGLFGLSDNWVTHAKRLSEHFSVFVPDLRNHGQSPHSSVFNYQAMADDLMEFIDDHDLDHPVIVGHSMGGKVAMEFALEYPLIPEKLVVIDISPVKYPERNAHFDILNAMRLVDFDVIHSRNDVSELLKLRIPDESTRLFVMKNLYRKTKDRFAWRLELNAVYNNMDRIFEGVESEDTFNKSTLFIKGALSNYILDEHWPLILKLFPLARLITIPGAGHWVHSDAPEELYTALSDFLT